MPALLVVCIFDLRLTVLIQTIGTEVPEVELLKLHTQLTCKLPARGRDFPKYTAAHMYAAMYVQAAVRGFITRHVLRNTTMMKDVKLSSLAIEDGGGDDYTI